MPFGLEQRLRRLRHRLARRPAVGRVHLGSLQRTQPISRQFGYDRGLCIDRFYIESFLAAHQGDIQGRVLEATDSTYTTLFSHGQVTRADTLDVRPEADASVILDLTSETLPADLANSFDCVILTQVLQFIYDANAALRTVERLLKPGGVVLATVPGISQISRGDYTQYGEFWRFTAMAADRLFADTFGKPQVEVAAQGNVLAAIALLHGLCVEDVALADLEVRDADYEVIVTIRAVKAVKEGGRRDLIP